ncbi:MAG: hypothetical protein OET18_10260 [Desulfobacterales bacterium]|jgi:hypothetical protein|nr:hypothetical protein [Desulfobacterales bacterium]
MAINVDNVYKTVLLVLNQEQRGYITPDEFNKTATQVQLDIFEKYFEDLNQQLRVTQADFDYSNRQTNIDDKISIFKCIGDCTFSSGKFSLPTTDQLTNTTIVYNDAPASSEFAFYRLGTVTYDDIEIQRLQRTEFYNIDKSDLTLPSVNFPVYLFESGKLNIKPPSIETNVEATFLRKPKNVNWGYSVGNLGQYIYDASSSVNFELHSSEQVNVITNILLYSGIIIQDPTIIQVAAQKIQQEDINEKS